MNKPNRKLQVILIANYRPDRQFSMQRFAALLAKGLGEFELEVTTLHPPVFAGKLGAAPQGLGKWLGYLDKYLLAPLYLRGKIRQFPQPRIVHICDHSNSFYTRILKGELHLVTCHDMLAVRSALGEFEHNRTSWSGRIQQRGILNGLKRAQHLACVSEATATDLKRLTGKTVKQVEVVSNALNPEFSSQQESPAANFTLPALASKPYLLHVGSDAWYKNRSAVLSVFQQIAAKACELHLAIVGPPFRDETLASHDLKNLSDRIHHLDSLSDEGLRHVYAGAELLLFPSIIEGFGWPILEAQACGTPVLTSQTAPMGELNALSELRISGDPTDPDWHKSAADACLSVLEMRRNQRSSYEQTLSTFCERYSLSSMAGEYHELYLKLLPSES